MLLTISLFSFTKKARLIVLVYHAHTCNRVPSDINVYAFRYLVMNIISAPLCTLGSRDSSVGIATGYGLDDQERREFESR
jgi:hypothetical protein